MDALVCYPGFGSIWLHDIKKTKGRLANGKEVDWIEGWAYDEIDIPGLPMGYEEAIYNFPASCVRKWEESR